MGNATPGPMSSLDPRFPILEIRPDSPGIPPDLWQVPEPPSVLRVQGAVASLALLERLPHDGLAIVGTRSPQLRSRARLREWIRELRGTGLLILSGFARGIDTVAHEAAIEAGLPTLAFMATGLDRLYPRENETLATRILEAGGLLVTEHGDGQGGAPHWFLQRNRLIAGWSAATFVVEAGQRSGALNTARWAREQERPCLTVPCFPGDPALAGNQILLDRDHAFPFWGPHSLGAIWLELAGLGVTPTRPGRRRSGPPPGSDPQHVAEQVAALTFEAGGASLRDLLGQAMERGWPPERFFLALQVATRNGQVIEQNGVLVSLPPRPSSSELTPIISNN